MSCQSYSTYLCCQCRSTEVSFEQEEPLFKRRRLEDADDSILLHKRQKAVTKFLPFATYIPNADEDIEEELANYERESPRSSTPVTTHSWDTSLDVGDVSAENTSSSHASIDEIKYFSAIDFNSTMDQSFIILFTRDACLQKSDACKDYSMTKTIDSGDETTLPLIL